MDPMSLLAMDPTSLSQPLHVPVSQPLFLGPSSPSSSLSQSPFIVFVASPLITTLLSSYSSSSCYSAVMWISIPEHPKQSVFAPSQRRKAPYYVAVPCGNHFLLRLHSAFCVPALNRSSEISRFKHSNAIEIRDGIIFDFYTGLPHILSVPSVLSLLFSVCLFSSYSTKLLITL